MPKKEVKKLMKKVPQRKAVNMAYTKKSKPVKNNAKK